MNILDSLIFLWKKLPKNIKWINIVLLLFGTILILVSLIITHEQDVIRHLLLTLGSIIALHAVESLVHHFLLHQDFVNSAVSEIDEKVDTHIIKLSERLEHKMNDIVRSNDFKSFKNEVIDEIKATATNEFIDKVYEVAEKSNNLLKHYKEIGLQNAFKRLNEDKIFKTIVNSYDEEFLILRIHFSDAEWNILTQKIKEFIITKRCRFKIILLSPQHTTAIAQRQQFLHHNPSKEVSNCISKIESQLLNLRNIKNSLPQEHKKHLDVRVHQSNLTCAMIGMGDKIVYSMYLHGTLSNEGVQYQVKEHSPAYNDLMKNFYLQWDNSFNYIVQTNGTIIYKPVKKS